eukprot:jgi/Botrbrau1/4609/Bobra.60_2s0094.1
MLVGHFQLATLVQYVPLPVVGGYLGYVGYFCLAAGVALACGVEVDSFPSWANLLAKDPAIKFVPTLAATAAMYLTMNYVSHPMALPAVLLAVPLAFHAVLLATGTSLQQAADLGWVMQPEPGRNFWEIYQLFNIHDLKLDGIYFPAMLEQVPKVMALFFVVAFGSCLDVAAIQADSPEPLDYNHELKTVGLSNLVVGLSGAGLTGSYIFSQTIFSMRAGIESRLHGMIIAVSEIALFLLPVSVVQYMPNFFFGSLLMLFGVEITLDWLFHSYHKVTRAEFALLWATYLAIMFTDLETGIGIGIVLATFFFAFSYARVSLKDVHGVAQPQRSGAISGGEGGAGPLQLPRGGSGPLRLHLFWILRLHLLPGDEAGALAGGLAQKPGRAGRQLRGAALRGSTDHRRPFLERHDRSHPRCLPSSSTISASRFQKCGGAGRHGSAVVRDAVEPAAGAGRGAGGHPPRQPSNSGAASGTWDPCGAPGRQGCLSICLPGLCNNGARDAVL